MFFDIDKFTNSDEVRLFLCKPNREIICELPEAFNKNLQISYGGVNELSFQVPYKVLKTFFAGNSDNFIRNPHVEYIRGDYIILLQHENQKEYFIITNPQHTANDGVESFSVNCYAQQYELKNKIVMNLSGVKNFYDPVGSEGFINETLFLKSDWTVNYCDSDFYDKTLLFEESNTNVLELLFTTCDKLSIIPVFDTVNKQISFYKESNLGIDEGLSIESGKYLKSIEYKENFDDICTRLYIVGNEDLNVSSKNITGQKYIEDFSFYLYPFERDSEGNVIKSSNYMSNELANAILDYQEVLENNNENFITLAEEYDTILQSIESLNAELDGLKDELEGINKQIDQAIANGDNLSALNSQKAAKQSQIISQQTEINNAEVDLSDVEDELQSLYQVVSIESNFTSEQIAERNSFIKERIWQDSRYVNIDQMLDEGNAKLKKLSQPSVYYMVDSVSFIQALNVTDDKDKLKIGNIVTIYYPNFNINIKAKIILIEWNIDEYQIKLTIANTKDIRSGYVKIQELLNRAATTSAEVDVSRFTWDKSQENESKINQVINSKWDATKQAVVAGANEKVSIDQRGITLIDPDNSNNILRLLSSVVAMSNDGGNSFRTGIDASGIVAENVYGKLGAFVQLKANQIIVGDSGEKISDSLISSANNWNGKTTLINGSGVYTGTVKATQIIVGDANQKISDSLISSASTWNGKTTLLTGAGIYTGTVNANQINANTLSAISANLGTITAGSISSVSINSSTVIGGTIIGTNIIGTSTITGATIQTSSNSNKLILDSSGFRSHDLSGIKRISIDSDGSFGYQELRFYGQNSLQVGAISGTNGLLNVAAVNGSTLILGGYRVVIGGSVQEVDFQNVMIRNMKSKIDAGGGQEIKMQVYNGNLEVFLNGSFVGQIPL